MAYKNVDYDTLNIELTSGDTWSQTFYVKRNNVGYDMTGQQMDIDVEDEDGATILSLSSAGINPAITINTTYFAIFYHNAFSVTEITKYLLDVQLTDPNNNNKISTIARGRLKVIPQYTE